MCCAGLLSYVRLFVTPWTVAFLADSSVHGDSPDRNTGVDCHALLQGIFPTQESNHGLLHCRWILYQLSHKRSPRILEWIAYPFSRGSSWPRNPTMVSCIAGGFFTNWAIREARWHKVLAWLYDSKAETVNLPSSCDWFTLFFLAINTFSLKAQYPLTTHSVLEIVLH